MMVTLYNVISKDGFIARKDGSEDFIPNDLWSKTLEVYKKYNTLVMGRKTYDVLQSYTPELLEPFEQLSIRKIVVSEDESFQPKPGYEVVHSLEDAIHESNTLVSSGPTVNTYLLKKGLIKEVLLHVIPVNIDEGIPQFEIGNAELASKLPVHVLS